MKHSGQPFDCESIYGGMRCVLVPSFITLEDPREIGKALAMWRFGLTQQEVALLEHLAAGLTNSQLALQLSVADETSVKNRLKVVFKKIKARNRAEAARIATLYGIAQINLPTA